jgi:hypothetical protein
MDWRALLLSAPTSLNEVQYCSIVTNYESTTIPITLFMPVIQIPVGIYDIPYSFNAGKAWKSYNWFFQHTFHYTITLLLCCMSLVRVYHCHEPFRKRFYSLCARSNKTDIKNLQTKKVNQKTVKWTSQLCRVYRLVDRHSIFSLPPPLCPYNRGRCHQHTTLLACYTDPLLPTPNTPCDPIRPQTKTPITHKYDRFRLCFVRAVVVVAVAKPVAMLYAVWSRTADGEDRKPCLADWWRKLSSSTLLYTQPLLRFLLPSGTTVRCIRYERPLPKSAVLHQTGYIHFYRVTDIQTDM